MKRLKVFFLRRILFRILLPVLIVGLLVSTVLVGYMSDPLEKYLIRQSDASLSLSSLIGLQTCEESFNYLLDLRLESNGEMNEVMQDEVLKKIHVMSQQFPDINLMVIESGKVVKMSSLAGVATILPGEEFIDKDDTTFDFRLDNKKVRAHLQFFPFWDWQILSFVYEDDYNFPIRLARKIIYLSATGVLFIVLLTLLVVFNFFVNSPLQRLVRATKGVTDGKPSKIDKISGDEFGQLTVSFNGMVDGLESEKQSVENLLKQLKESEALFRSQFEYGSIGIALVDKDEGWLQTNDRLCKMLGYSESELRTKSWPEIVQPDDLVKGMARFRSLLADERENFNLDIRLIHRLGQAVYTHISASCVRNPDRTAKYAIVSVVDISERKIAEQALQETNTKLRLVLDTIPVRVFWKDLEGRYIGGNEAFSKDAGLATSEELLGKTDFDLAFAAQAEAFRKDDMEVMSSGKPHLFYEEQQDRLDGTTGWLLTTKVAMRDEQQNIVGVLGTYHDITDEKRANEELRRLRNYLSNIIDSMPSILVGVTREGLITQWNLEAKKKTGLAEQDAIGQSLDKVLPQLSDELVRVDSAITSRQQHSEIKKSVSDRNQPLYEKITVYPLITNGVDGAVIRIDDVTREQQLEAQLNHSRKLEAIGTLAGGVAHDFNNMLGGILGATELLGFYLPDEPKPKKLHQTILDATTRAADLTRKLLSFSRQSPLASTVIDVHGIIEETVVLLENTIDRRIVLNVDLQADKSTIVGDPSQLQSVFLNLGINASQSMPDGGKLTISTEKLEIDDHYCQASTFDIKPGAYLAIDVRDTGCGIPLEDQSRIFDPFFTTKAQGAGTGLGLAAVYGTVQQHKGAIHIYSDPDSGTSFQVLLPISDEHVVFDTSTHPIIRGSGRILVVDDEDVMRVTAQAILEDLGYQVVLAENGQQGVEIFTNDEGHFDLVVLDMVMPIMNGRDCFLLLKQHDDEVRVILASGFSREEDIKEMRMNGLEGFIRKPYSRSSLSQVVHNALR